MACSPFSCITQAPSHSASVGQTRPQLSPRILASRITRAEPRRLPVRIFLINAGTSMRVGQARVHGASKQRSEEHTSELQSRLHLVCRLLLEKKKTKKTLDYPESPRALP